MGWQNCRAHCPAFNYEVLIMNKAETLQQNRNMPKGSVFHRNSIDEINVIKDVTQKLLAYCRTNNWAGYDPYDALNSKLFNAVPLFKFKLFRLVLTQAVKRSPVNLRPLLLVPKGHNPKGIALFLSSLTRLNRLGLARSEEIFGLAQLLLELRTPDTLYSSWGYNFPWQTRGILVPLGTPNIICTTFAAEALLDVWELTNNSIWLKTAESAANYIFDKLLFRKPNSEIFFSYTPLGQSQIHNANLLGAALIARIGRITDNNKYIINSLEAASYSVNRQNKDGSWYYGESPAQKWIDNFHTGFNLVALNRIARFAETKDFTKAINHGFQYYKENLFLKNGTPKYFNNSVYPIDIHCVAQGIITFAEFFNGSSENLDFARLILFWSLKNMWDHSGYFYFQQKRFYKVKTSFIRWSQAWMLLALSAYLEKLYNHKNQK